MQYGNATNTHTTASESIVSSVTLDNAVHLAAPEPARSLRPTRARKPPLPAGELAGNDKCVFVWVGVCVFVGEAKRERLRS